MHFSWVAEIPREARRENRSARFVAKFVIRGCTRDVRRARGNSDVLDSAIEPRGRLRE